MTVVDVAWQYKEAESLVSKGSKEIANALSCLSRRSPLPWPKTLQVYPGRLFIGGVKELLSDLNSYLNVM